MLRVKPVWWIPIGICIIVGVIGMIPVGAGESTFLPYRPVIPLAPISSLLIWIIGGGFFVFLGRRSTDRPIRTPLR
ncbi:MAG: hypothetical protein IBX68_09830 [Dehalococcoidia bacterium]|nr:hypothetical protein [Dehalococcoidia bacterium]